MAILAVAVGGNAPGSQDMSEVRFMDLEYFDRNEVDELLQEAAANEQRMHSLEQSLEASFQSLPKTTDGLLTHHAVRYILHRFFLHTHGWLVKGLEPEGLGQWQPGSVFLTYLLLFNQNMCAQVLTSHSLQWCKRMLVIGSY